MLLTLNVNVKKKMIIKKNTMQFLWSYEAIFRLLDKAVFDQIEFENELIFFFHLSHVKCVSKQF